MDDIQVAIDESQAGLLLTRAQALLGSQSRSGSSNLGPFGVSWSAQANLSGGSVDLRAPDIVRIADLDLNFSLSLGLSFDLSEILPDFCLPRVCVRIPFIGRVCTPRVCVDWPTITLPTISHSGTVTTTADFRLNTRQDGSEWVAEVEIVAVPVLQLDAISTLIVTAILGAVAVALSAIPFIGPFLALATGAIAAIFGVAAVTGLLGQILTPFLAGLTFELYREAAVQEVLAANGPTDPAVSIRITDLDAEVQISDEDELVLLADIAPV